MSDSFIPRSFQLPNDYIDRFMSFLTPEEFKILAYAARRIFGFQKRQDRISLGQFCNGITAADGHKLDNGTGMGLKGTRKAVNGLVAAGLLIKLEDAKWDHTPALYSLQLNPDLVDVAFLKARQVKNTKSELVSDGVPVPTTPVETDNWYPTDSSTGIRQTPELVSDGVPTINRENKLKQQTTHSPANDLDDSGNGCLLFSDSSFSENEIEPVNEPVTFDKDPYRNHEPVKSLQGMFPNIEGECSSHINDFFTEAIEKFGIAKVSAFLSYYKIWGKAYHVSQKYPDKLPDWNVEASAESDTPAGKPKDIILPFTRPTWNIEWTTDGEKVTGAVAVWSDGEREELEIVNGLVTFEGTYNRVPLIGATEFLSAYTPDGEPVEEVRTFTADGWQTRAVEPGEVDLIALRRWDGERWNNIPSEGSVDYCGNTKIYMAGGIVTVGDFHTWQGGPDGAYRPATYEEAARRTEFVNSRRSHPEMRIILKESETTE